MRGAIRIAALSQAGTIFRDHSRFHRCHLVLTLSRVIFFLFLDLILGSVTFVKAKDGKRG